VSASCTASRSRACASSCASTDLAWPLPALLAWAAAWAAYAASRALPLSAPLAFALAAALGVALGWRATTPWRRVFVASGFPLSFAAIGAAAIPPWAWLLPLGLLILAYPFKAWRDAPLFPTPTGALRGLGAAAPLAGTPRILDAGCGLGAGLVELRREYPQARLHGLEWSWPLRLACAWRCRDMKIRRADIWQAPWHDYDLVYLFQRPESLPRAMRKAAEQMKAGAWLASLEFEASAWRPEQVLHGADGRPVWLYRLPLRSAGAA
jgi:SAM-dependent methyltransferase